MPDADRAYDGERHGARAQDRWLHGSRRCAHLGWSRAREQRWPDTAGCSATGKCRRHRPGARQRHYRSSSEANGARRRGAADADGNHCRGHTCSHRDVISACSGACWRSVVSGGIAITINSVNRTSSVGQFFKAKPGNVIVTADTLVENVSRGTTPYNAFYFKVKDSDGFEYTTGLGGDNAMKSGELAKSEKVRGTVSFEVPEKASGLVLSYQPIVLFGGYQVIRVSLED